MYELMLITPASEQSRVFRLFYQISRRYKYDITLDGALTYVASSSGLRPAKCYLLTTAIINHFGLSWLLLARSLAEILEALVVFRY